MASLGIDDLDDSYKAQLCGGSNEETMYSYSVTLPEHVASSVTIRFQATLTQDLTVAWWGLSQIFILPRTPSWPPMDDFEDVSFAPSL